MEIQEIKKRIIEKYPLDDKIDCSLTCYRVAKKRYVVFWDDIVNKSSIELILNKLEQETAGPAFTEWRTLIVVGSTSDSFEKADLVYFNNVNMFVVFYLINESSNQIFMEDSWIFMLGANYQKYVRTINKIVNDLYGLDDRG